MRCSRPFRRFPVSRQSVGSRAALTSSTRKRPTLVVGPSLPYVVSSGHRRTHRNDFGRTPTAGPSRDQAPPPAGGRRLRRRLSGRRRMVDTTTLCPLRIRGVDSVAGHPGGSHQGSGSGQAGVHREARRPARRQGCAALGAHLRNGLDVRPGRAGAPSPAKAADAAAARKGPRELPADHRGQHAAGAALMADGPTVRNAAGGA